MSASLGLSVSEVVIATACQLSVENVVSYYLLMGIHIVHPIDGQYHYQLPLILSAVADRIISRLI